MSWLKRLFGEDSEHQVEQTRSSTVADAQMGPGLTGQYDWTLRENAGMHEPPIPPENMGLVGEFDEQGLAKRVAAAFDQVPTLQSIETVEITQEGCTVILSGSISEPPLLDRMIKEASKVDGTKAVNTDRIMIQAT